MLTNKGKENTTKLAPNAVQELKINQRRILIDSLEIGIPAPEQMIALGERQLPNGVKVGQLLNSKTLNYKKFTPHRDGLFCERIFGPVQSFVCACGKKKESVQGKNRQKEVVNTNELTPTSIIGGVEVKAQPQKQALFCPKCQVEYISKDVRRHRLGYIKLFAPVTHIWYLKGRPSYLSLFLGKRKKAMTSLAYCNSFLVEQIYSEFKFETQNVLKNVSKSTAYLLEKTNVKRKKRYHVNSLHKKQVFYKFDKANALYKGGKDKNFALRTSFVKNQVFSHALVTPDWYKTHTNITTQTTKTTGNQSKALVLNTTGAPGSAGENTSYACVTGGASNKRANKSEAFVQAFVRPCVTAGLNKSKAFVSPGAFFNCGENSFFSLLIKLFPETNIQNSTFANPTLSPIKENSFDKEEQEIKEGTGANINLFLFYLNKVRLETSIIKQNQDKNKYGFFQNSTALTRTLYIRAQTLPFLPSLISPFHLRDCLISFLQSSPSTEDVPIPFYCQTPRRYPLRDVHKFITELRSQEATKKAEKLTNKSITRLIGFPEQEKASRKPYSKKAQMYKDGIVNLFVTKVEQTRHNKSKDEQNRGEQKRGEQKRSRTKASLWLRQPFCYADNKRHNKRADKSFSSISAFAPSFANQNFVLVSPGFVTAPGLTKTKFWFTQAPLVLPPCQSSFLTLSSKQKAKIKQNNTEQAEPFHNKSYRSSFVAPFGLMNMFTRLKVTTFTLPGANQNEVLVHAGDNTSSACVRPGTNIVSYKSLSVGPKHGQNEQNKAISSFVTSKKKNKLTLFFTKAEREVVKVLPFFFKYQYKSELSRVNKVLLDSPGKVPTKTLPFVRSLRQQKQSFLPRYKFMLTLGSSFVAPKKPEQNKALFGHRGHKKFTYLYFPTLLYVSRSRFNIEQIGISKTEWNISKAPTRQGLGMLATKALQQQKLRRPGPKAVTQAELVFRTNALLHLPICYTLLPIAQKKQSSFVFFPLNYKSPANLSFNVQKTNSEERCSDYFSKVSVDYQFALKYSYKHFCNTIKKEIQTYQARLLHMVFGIVNKNSGNKTGANQSFSFGSAFVTGASTKSKAEMELRFGYVRPFFTAVVRAQKCYPITVQKIKLVNTLPLPQIPALFCNQDKNISCYRNILFQLQSLTLEQRATKANIGLNKICLMYKRNFVCSGSTLLQIPLYCNSITNIEKSVGSSNKENASLVQTLHKTTSCLLETGQQKKQVTLFSRPFSSFIQGIKSGDILTISFSINLPFFISGSKQNEVVLITKKERKVKWTMGKAHLALVDLPVPQAQPKPSSCMLVDSNSGANQNEVLVSPGMPVRKAKLILPVCFTCQNANSVWKQMSGDTVLQLPFSKKCSIFLSNASECIIGQTDQRFVNLWANQSKALVSPLPKTAPSFKASTDFISSCLPDSNVFSCILVKKFKISKKRTFNRAAFKKSIKLYKTCVNQVEQKKSDNTVEQQVSVTGAPGSAGENKSLNKSEAFVSPFVTGVNQNEVLVSPGIHNFIKKNSDQSFKKMWFEQKYANSLTTRSYRTNLRDSVLNTAVPLSAANNVKLKSDQVKAFTDTDQALYKDGQTSFGSEIISKWHLNGAKEILSYTGGGALESLLKRFNISLFYEFLFCEIQVLRKYYKDKHFFLAYYNKNKTLEKQNYSFDINSVKPSQIKKTWSDLNPKSSDHPNLTGASNKTGKWSKALVLNTTGNTRANKSFSSISALVTFKTNALLHLPVQSRLVQKVRQVSTLNVYERRSHLVKTAIKSKIPNSYDIGKNQKSNVSISRLDLSRQENHFKVEHKQRATLQHSKALLVTEKSANSFCRRIYRTTRRLKIVQLLMRSQRRPEWMMISILPVLPPDLRPVLQMGENLIVASDLNTLYQRVIYRNNRHYKGRFLDFHFVSSIHRLVQDAVDRLIENGKGGSTPFLTPGGRPLKSLSDILKGKRGRFRFNLLGKRVDFSARSVIVVSPNLQIHECGLPREIALELYKYLLIRQLVLKKRVSSIVNAKKVIKQRKPFIWDMLREIIYYHPLLLNRAPTLHRLGIQAFQPKLTLGNAILLHPLVCAGFNADFDGDQMGVHLPLSPQARAEAWDLLWSRNNLLSPATGQPILLPSQDMVLGFYYMTALLPSGITFTPRDEEQQKSPEKLVRKQSFALESTIYKSSITSFNNYRLSAPFAEIKFVHRLKGKGPVSNKTGAEEKRSFGYVRPFVRTGQKASYVPPATYVFCDTSQVVHAYQKKQIDIHTPIWLKWVGKSENGEKHQIPLELRLDTFASKTQIYPTYTCKSKGYKKKNTSFFSFQENNTVSISMRTTVGRVLVNNLINRVNKPR